MLKKFVPEKIVSDWPTHMQVACTRRLYQFLVQVSWACVAGIKLYKLKIIQQQPTMTSCVSAGDLYQSKSSVGIACTEAIKLNWLSACSTFNSPLHLTPPVKWPLYLLLWRWRTTHSLTHPLTNLLHSPHSLYLPHPTAQFSNLHQLPSLRH